MKRLLIVAFLSFVSLSAFAGSPNLNMNGHKIINVANPTSAQDVATQSYVESYVATHAGAGGGGGGGSIGNTGVTPGSYGDGTHVASFVVQADGRLVAAASATISIPATAISNASSIGRSMITAIDVPTEQTLLNIRPGVDIEVYDSDLAALAALTFSSDKCVYWTGAAAPALYTCSAAGRAWAALADAAAQTAALLVFNSSTKGLVPSGGNSTQCLHGDGTWSACTGSSSVNATTAETTTPAAPISGNVTTWVSNTDHRLHDLNSSSVQGTTVVASTAGSNQVATGLSSAGVIQYTTASALAFSAAMSDMGTFSSSTLFSRVTDEVGSGHVMGDTSPVMSGATLNGTTTLGGPVTGGAQHITNISYINYTLTNDGNKGGAAPAFADFTVSADHTMTLTSSATGIATWTWPTVAAGTVYVGHMEICQGSGGNFTIANWPTSPFTLTWLNGTPVLSTSAGTCDYFALRNDGSKITGQFISSSGGGGLSAPVANSSLATMAANTVKANNTGSTATPTDVSMSSLLTAIAALPLAGGAMTGSITGTHGYAVASTSTVSKTGANVALCDFTASTNCDITLTGSLTGISTCTMPAGDTNGLTIWVHQSTGSMTIATWCPNTHWVGSIGTPGSAPTLSIAASALDIVSCKAKGSNLYCAAGTSN